LNKLVSSKKFILNTAPLNIQWNPNWSIIELSIRNWDNAFYKKIRLFRREYQSNDFLLDSTGRKLVFITYHDKISDEEISKTIRELSKYLETEISYTKIEISDFSKIHDHHLQDTITNSLGEFLSHKLQNELQFEKTGSVGSVGRYFHHKISKSVRLSSKPEIDIVSHIEFILQIDWTSTYKPYLSIDLKSQVDGILTLYDLAKSKKQETRYELSSYKKDQLYWKICQNIALAEWKEIFSDDFELLGFIEWKEGKLRVPNLFSYGNLKDKPLQEFLRNVGLTTKRDEYVALLKRRKDTNPNARYYWPISLLEQKITNSFIMGKPYENKFHQLSKPTVIERKETLVKIFQMLEKEGLTNSIIEFESVYPKIAYPSVNGKSPDQYGKIPNLWSTGVQDWGNLSRIKIYSTERNMDLADNLKKELEKTLNDLASKSKRSKISMSSEKYSYKSIQKIAEEEDNNPEATLHIFIRGKGKSEPQYNRIKEWFTVENKKPVQFFRVDSLLGRKIKSTVRTVIPQIIAKTGGLPYELSPKILDNALIIGLDKGRDSYSEVPSASAGVAAITPKGEYVAGASTKIDTTKHDSIDVDELAPELLEQLIDEYGENLEYVVILRDGSPQISLPEVKPWKEHLESYGLKMIFFASRKENAYRVFPKHIHYEKKTKYNLPVILNGTPLPKNEFLVITANPIQGTPKPVLYTLLANTTDFDEDTIINKVIPQVISMSMLCWESPHPTSQPLPLHYADKLAEFTQKTKRKWRSSIRPPMFI